MSVEEKVHSGIVEANGARLYHEIRGSGPSVVFVPGATGDAGHFEYVADLLADEFTCVTYDRRGNSRSRQPARAEPTSTEEQAADLVGLITALGVGPAAVYGTSGGAIITLAALLGHQEQFRGAIVHEPPLMSVLARPDEAMGVVQPIIETGMARGGPHGALEAFLGFAAGDALGALPSATVERMMGNAEVLFGSEFGVFESWRPDEEALRRLPMPVTVMCGAQAVPFFAEASRWIAERVGTDVVAAPGTHVPNFDRPADLAAALRPILRAIR